MSPVARALVVSLASYALISTVVSVWVWAVWHRVRHRELGASQMLTLRVLPFLCGVGLTSGVLVPSFARFEPAGQWEEVGPLVLLWALVGTALIVYGALRACRAATATRAVAAQWKTLGQHRAPHGTVLEVIDVSSPIVALVGIWRPRMVVARPVYSACSAEEVTQIANHELAHRAANDNLKCLALAAIPDVLSWLPASLEMRERWHAAAEVDADERAVGASREARLALASALVKVARLAVHGERAHGFASQLIGEDGVESRVRRLLTAARPRRVAHRWTIPVALAALTLLAVPWHGSIYALAEACVALWR